MNRGFAAIGLDHPKCPANVGGAMRAAGCYGASIVAMAGHRFGKAPTDVQKQWRLTPVIQTDDLRLVVPLAPVRAPGACPCLWRLLGKVVARRKWRLGPSSGSIYYAFMQWTD